MKMYFASASAYVGNEEPLVSSHAVVFLRNTNQVHCPIRILSVSSKEEYLSMIMKQHADLWELYMMGENLNEVVL